MQGDAILSSTIYWCPLHSLVVGLIKNVDFFHTFFDISYNKILYITNMYRKFYNRKTPRAQWYDYSSPGMYFITVCTKNRAHYFGDIQNNHMFLSKIGVICDQQLHIMLSKRPYIDMHQYIIMPNHAHLLFYIHTCTDSGLPCPNDDQKYYYDNKTPQVDVPTIQHQYPSLWSVIWWRKSATSRISKKQWLHFARQSRYHDHIVRNKNEYINIKQYIKNNPMNWIKDTCN